MGGTVSQETREKASEAAGLVKETVKGAYGDVSSKKLSGKYRLPEKKALDDNDFSFLMQNTGKTRDEVINIFEKYGLRDQNSKINKEEFINIYQELHKESRDHVQDVATHVFKAFDSENTGFISFNEFLVAYALTNRGDMRKKLNYSFDLYDTNKRGYLQKNEVRDVVAGMVDVCGGEKRYSKPQELVDRTVREMQFDQQDNVSKDEFINGLMKNQDVRTLLSPFSLAS